MARRKSPSLAAVADPDPEEPALGYQEDDPVWGTLLRVKGLGDGLSKLAEVQPVALRRQARVVLIVEAFVDFVSFPPGENEWGEQQAEKAELAEAEEDGE